MIEVFHLVWKPLGPEPLRRFVESYLAHPAGMPHQLTLILNGFQSEEEIMTYLNLLPALEFTRLRAAHPLMDLACYRMATQQSGTDWNYFFNSYSQILSDDWLAKLMGVAQEENIGLVGASGSWQSRLSRFVRGIPRLRFRRPLYNRLKWSLMPYLMLRLLPHYPMFPNPHLRTNAFGGRTTVLRQLWPRHLRTKEETYRCESGYHSLTRKTLRRGGKVKVVGCDGAGYDIEAWQQSDCFAGKSQKNLLVADNQTEKYRCLDPAGQAETRFIHWGAL